VKIEQRKAREIARAHANGIGGMIGRGAPDIFAVTRLIILHADRGSDLLVKRREDGLSNRTLVDRPERVEIPVVVVPESPGRTTAARRAQPGHARRFIECGVEDARARFQQLSDGGGLLGLGQARGVVVDAEAADAGLEIDLVLIHRDPDQGAEQALAHRMQVRLDRGIAPFGDDAAVLDDHDGRGRLDLL
jgi:hypothetical protein